MIEIIDRVTDPAIRARAVARYRERGIALPTFAQMRDPRLVPPAVVKRLADLGLWDLDPLNLYRITWKNEPRERGGLYGGVNYLELPPALTGVPARIVMLVGKWFPTGAHKVGAAYGCLAPKIISGGFDPTYHKAVWPSTGNYCRGGAFDSYLMGCTAVAILPAAAAPVPARVASARAAPPAPPPAASIEGSESVAVARALPAVSKSAAPSTRSAAGRGGNWAKAGENGISRPASERRSVFMGGGE